MQESSRVAVKLIRGIVGAVVLLIGIAGLFLPILPGWLLIFAGLAVLARDFAWAERLHVNVQQRVQRARKRFDNRDDDPIAERDAA